MTARILMGVFALFLAGAAVAEEPGIVNIRKEYQAIRTALPRLKTERVELSGYSPEGGEARAFREGNGNIRLVQVELLFESGKVLQEFYFENGSLIFALYTRRRYNAPFFLTPREAKEIGGEAFDPKKTVSAEDRYYFANGKMIRWLDEKKSQVNPQGKEFMEAEKEILETSNEMLSRFSRKS